MNGPRCEQPTLNEQDRDGITIDKCEKCRGIWLDRGELEKLLARRPEKKVSDEDQADRVRERGKGRDDDDEDDDDDRRGGRRRGSIWDLFD